MFWSVPSEKTFYTFSFQHMMTMLFVVIAIGFIFLFKVQIEMFKYESILRYTVATIMVIGLILEQVWTVYHGLWTVKASLPISICTLTEIIAIYMLISKSYVAFGFVYFGMAATTQALLTPSLAYGFPALSFLCYFVKHGLLMITPIYMIAVHHFFPVQRQLWRYAFSLIACVPILLLLNKIVDGNYWYMTSKTADISLLNYLGPYPWFLFSVLGIGIVLLYLYYLPFAILKRGR